MPPLRSQTVPQPPPRSPAAAAIKTVPAQPARAAESDPAKVARRLDELIRTALDRNPDLMAAREALSAARHRVRPAGMPDDPLLGFRMKDLPTTFSMTRENATEKQIEVAERYPFPGKLSLAQEIAGKRADEAAELMHDSMVRLVTQVRSTFAGIFVVDKEIEVEFEHQRRLRTLVDIATSKYKVGPGLQQDMLNADVALAHVDSTLIELRRRRTTREIKLATLLDFDRIEVPALGVLPAVSLSHPRLELERMALATNPLVRERERTVERAELAVRLARMAPLPDMVIGGAYGLRENHPAPAALAALNRPDLVSGQIMFSIPLFYSAKQREQLAEAEAGLRRERARLEASKRAAIGGLHDLLNRLRQHEQVAASFRDEVIPVARAAVSASVSAYQVNKVDFLTMLAAQDNLDRYKSEYWYNEAERFRDLALIDEVTGAVLTDKRWSR